MKNFSKILIRILGLLLILSVLSGCSTQDVRVDREYTNRITEAKLQIAPVTQFRHSISVSAEEYKQYKEVPPFIKDSQNQEVQNILQNMPLVFPPQMVKAAQEVNGLKIKTEGEADISLIFTLKEISTRVLNFNPGQSPLSTTQIYFMTTDYNLIKSLHGFVYKVELRDNKTGKEIWYGESVFRVENYSKTVAGQEILAKAVEEFATKVALEIDRYYLVKKGTN